MSPFEINQPGTLARPTAPTSENQPFSDLQLLALTRLARLLQLRPQSGDETLPSGVRLRLIRKATYSTYCDCVSLDVGEIARELIQKDTGSSA